MNTNIPSFEGSPPPAHHHPRASFVAALFGIVLGLGLVLAASRLTRAAGTMKYWIAGSSSDFSLDANWSTTSGGTNDTTAPGPTDIAVFDGSGAGIVDLGNINVSGVRVRPGFAGILSQSGASRLVIGADGFHQSAGTFLGGIDTIAVSGPLTLTGGTFRATASGMSVAGNWIDRSGSFQHNNGRVILSGGSQIIAEPAVLSGFTVNIPADRVTLSGGLTIAGAFRWVNGAIDSGSLTLRGPVAVEAGADGSIAGTGTLLIAGTGTQNCSIAAGATLSALTLNNAVANCMASGAGTVTTTKNLRVSAGSLDLGVADLAVQGSLVVNGGTFRGGGAVSVQGNLTLDSGIFYGGQGNLSVQRTLAINGGSFTSTDQTLAVQGDFLQPAGSFAASGGTLALTGTGKTFDVNGSMVLQNLTVNLSSSTRTLRVGNGDTLLVYGTYSWSQGAIDAGTVTALGSVIIGAGANGHTTTASLLSVAGAGAQTCTINVAARLSGFSINNTAASCVVSGPGTLRASGSVLVSRGTFSINGAAFKGSVLQIGSGGIFALQGTETLNPLPTLLAGSTVAFTGPAGSYILPSWAYYGLTINAPGATYAPLSAIALSGSLAITAGSLDMSPNNYALSVVGNFTNAGTFIPRAGTVTLKGTNQTLSGSTTFYSLVKSAVSAYTLSFAAGSTQTVTHALTLTGINGANLSLRSTVPGTQWRMDPQGSRTIQFVDVRDSNNINAAAIDCSAVTCINSRNNTNWLFSYSIPPLLTEVTPVPSPTADTTPNYTFSSDQAGVLSLSGSCLSPTVSVGTGSTTITLSTLVSGTYSRCFVRVVNNAHLTGSLLMSTFTVDADPPVMLSYAPTGVLPYTTTGVSLSMTTDENAVCRYDRSSGTPFAQMPGVFTGTGTTHSGVLISVEKNSINRVMVRCQDLRGVTATQDSFITILVADTPAPPKPQPEYNASKFSGGERLRIGVKTALPVWAGNNIRDPSTSRGSMVLALPLQYAQHGSLPAEPVVEPKDFVQTYENGVRITFYDVPKNAWFGGPVQTLVGQRIVSGYRTFDGKPTGEFRPDAPVTYAEFAKMVAAGAGMNVDARAAAANPSARGWPSPYVATMERSGISIFSQASLNVQEPMPRMAAVQLVLEAFGVPVYPAAAAFYKDVPVDHPFAPAILRATLDGIVTGDKSTRLFRPEQTLNRAEASKLLLRAMQKYRR